ncbi:hypothetical protein LUZ61_000441 [Rhynchospora tenuis]|uniref:Nuclear speckle splicing regulatory protein 1 N-terminal domain-containing protein n=1 Tax=Rhynchospora tenuis TaxID=198213 RepID=A0AAD5ZF14_9POAL|nr:hypothetical protein LUZ61_000441 [Rhynchospora tenuis]
MKKYYGLQIKPGQSSKPSAAPARRPPASIFGGDDDDDVEKEISRQASKTASLQKIEQQRKKALEEDPSVFDYDGVYDDMKEKIEKPKVQDKSERKSKYIEGLMAKAKEREREYEIIYEKKLIKERSKEDHLYGDKEKFVTSAYRKKLTEQAKWLEEDRLRQLKEEQDDVSWPTCNFSKGRDEKVLRTADQTRPVLQALCGSREASPGLHLRRRRRRRRREGDLSPGLQNCLSPKDRAAA